MSSQLILPDLEIQGFRAFRKLTIERLGRVNLIVGKNNVGKTSILEALRLYAKPGPQVLLDLISTRDEFIDLSPRLRLKGSRPTPVPIQAIFHGRAANPDRTFLISIGPIGDAYKTLLLNSTSEKHQRMRQGDPSSEDINGDPLNGMPFVSIRVGPHPARDLPIDDPAKFLQYDRIEVATVKCNYIDSNGLDPRSAVMLWRDINLTDFQQDIRNSLKIIEPRIAQISANVYSADRFVPIVRLEGSSEPVALRSMGDGMVRLFYLALSLVNSRGGLLLVDEIENGLHYSVHEDLWKLVFKMARDLDVQVFATTHSWDCIEAFQRAACEDVSSDGYLIRLGWKRDEVVATVYDENDLAVVTRDHIEVR